MMRLRFSQWGPLLYWDDFTWGVIVGAPAAAWRTAVRLASRNASQASKGPQPVLLLPPPPPAVTVTITSTSSVPVPTTVSIISTVFATVTQTAPAPTPTQSTVLVLDSESSPWQWTISFSPKIYSHFPVTIIMCAVLVCTFCYMSIRAYNKATAPHAAFDAAVEEPPAVDLPFLALDLPAPAAAVEEPPTLAAAPTPAALHDLPIPDRHPPSPAPSFASLFELHQDAVTKSAWLDGYPHLVDEPSIPPSALDPTSTTCDKGKAKASEAEPTRERVSPLTGSCHANASDLALSELGPLPAEEDAEDAMGVVRRLAAELKAECANVGASPHAGPSSTLPAAASRMSMAELDGPHDAGGGSSSAAAGTQAEKENVPQLTKDQRRASRLPVPSSRGGARVVPHPVARGVGVRGQGPRPPRTEVKQAHATPTGVWLLK